MLSKILDLFFHKKKSACGNATSRKKTFLLIKNLYGKKKTRPKKCQKRVQNFGRNFGAFFGFFGVWFFFAIQIFYRQKTCFFQKRLEKISKIWFLFRLFLTTKILTHFFRLFWLFFRFRPGPGGSILIQSLVFLSRFTVRKKKLFFDRKLFFQNDLGIKNFLANRPSLIR